MQAWRCRRAGCVYGGVSPPYTRGRAGCGPEQGSEVGGGGRLVEQAATSKQVPCTAARVGACLLGRPPHGRHSATVAGSRDHSNNCCTSSPVSQRGSTCRMGRCCKPEVVVACRRTIHFPIHTGHTSAPAPWVALQLHPPRPISAWTTMPLTKPHSTILPSTWGMLPCRPSLSDALPAGLQGAPPALHGAACGRVIRTPTRRP